METYRVTFEQREDWNVERTETIVLPDNWNDFSSKSHWTDHWQAQYDRERFAIEMAVAKTYGSVTIINWQQA
jgi:hypothetical protein